MGVHSILVALCCVVSGHVHAVSGTPLAGAAVVLHGSKASTTAVTDAGGTFSATAAPGDYQLTASVRGYVSASVDVKVERDSSIDVTLEPVDAPTLHTIAAVTVDGRLAPEHGAVPSVAVTRGDFDRRGNDLVVQGLMLLPSTTFSHPDGGGENAIQVVSLRGPDPSETLIALDGQLLNDGNTGDVDMSRMPVAAFTTVDVTEGLGPADSEGSNTIGGSVNLVSLRPTKDPHEAFMLSSGSPGSSEQWLNTTGSLHRLGYAFAADNQNEEGFVHQSEQLNVATTPAPLTPLGSTVAAHSALANLTWTFSQNADVSARVFVLGDVRDQSGSINGLSTDGSFVGAGSQTLAQDIRAYQVRSRAPLGSGEIIAELSADNDSVNVDGNVNNPMYDVAHVDKRSNEAVSWERTFENSHYAVGGYSRYETLNFLNPAGAYTPLAQNIFSSFVRGGWQASRELQLDAAAYVSHYSTFGSNLDGRIGAVLNTSPSTAFRFSAGTGFRAPLLIERYPFPVSQLAPDGNGVYVGQGNPNEQPEHATEYELGMSHRFSNDAAFDASLYRTNLRDPIENYYPLAAVAAGICAVNLQPDPPPPDARCFSYPVNVGNVVYEGAELRFVQRFTPQHLFLTAMYGLNVAFPTKLGSTISNPTSGGNLVNDQQFLGIPQQQGSLELDWAKDNLHGSLSAAFRGNNNEYNQGPLTFVNASAGVRVGAATDIMLVGTNLFNDGAGRFTVFGGGVPYRGVVSSDAQGNPIYGPLPTNAYAAQPFALKLMVTVRR